MAKLYCFPNYYGKFVPKHMFDGKLFKIICVSHGKIDFSISYSNFAMAKLLCNRNREGKVFSIANFE
jgi:hypothetical protein